MNLQNSWVSNKNAILLMQKLGIPVYDHYKMFKNINYNNASQKRLAKFALIKYRIISGITVHTRNVCNFLPSDTTWR